MPGRLELAPRALGVVILAIGEEGGRERVTLDILHGRHLSAWFADEGGPLGREALTDRLIDMLDRRQGDEPSPRTRLGLFGAGLGAAAALCAAAARPGRVGAVVARGGRPDLAAACLPRLRVPTLLIVTAGDAAELHRGAMRSMDCEKRLEVVPGATWQTEGPGALEAVAHLAADWFALRLGTPWRAA